jgi:DnaJ-class molecular chaperone
MSGGRSESASIAGMVDADDCRHCDGSGQVVWGLYDTLYTDDCETCDGEGMVPA